MYLKEFPDINWLRLNARQNFRSFPQEGWPSVIMNTKTSSVERDDISGPFSIFFNVSGTSKVRVDNTWFSVSSDVYCLSNKGQEYDLHIPKFEKAETFNLHFGERLYNDVINVFAKRQRALMDYSGKGSFVKLELLPKLGWMSPDLLDKVNQLYRYGQQANGEYSTDVEYELMSGILEHILSESINKLKRIEKLNALKSATRTELFRRVSLAVDFMHSNIFREVHLDELSFNCGLSKFHLLRVFKEIYGLSPREYMNSLRLTKANELLRKSDMGLSDIALLLGFSEASAFTRFFKRHTRLKPSHLRV